VIGLCAAVELARVGPWEETVTLLPANYARAVRDAGAIALLLPPDDALAEAPDELLDLLDGLVLAGGCDVDPITYGARPHPETKDTDPARDRFELALAHRALERELPLLGVCRGMQMLNVAAGGTLEQHLDTLATHRHTPGAYSDHEVELTPGSLAARAAGAERVAVRSHHHQGIGELGEGLAITGRARGDGLAEAVELPERPFALGVLWHPEEDVASRVIAALVNEAAATRAAAR
jgi:putative glutamine amidotransferase